MLTDTRSNEIGGILRRDPNVTARILIDGVPRAKCLPLHPAGGKTKLAPQCVGSLESDARESKQSERVSLNDLCRDHSPFFDGMVRLISANLCCR